MQQDEVERGAGEGPALAPWQLRLTAPDDSLSPIVAAGQSVVVDCSDKELVDGALIAVRHGDALALWVFREGFAGIGVCLGGRAIATLGGLGGAFRLRGPVERDGIRLVGRVLEPADQGHGRQSALAALERQYRELQALRETTAAALRERPPLPDAHSIWSGARSADAVAEQLAVHLADRPFAERFALEQRLDSVDARLRLLDELIADARPTGLRDALVKLEALWQLQPGSAVAADVESRLLGSALTVLRRLAEARQRGARSTNAFDAPGLSAETAAGVAGGGGEGRAQPLELVTSPRQRRV